MKFLILAASLLALASASWETIHEKYNGPLHYPKIHKGVPVEPAAVQHAREAHLIALSEASKNQAYSHNSHHDAHYEADNKKWQGPKHYPVIYKGVPVETAEVQHAREAHLKALSEASHGDNHFEQYHGYSDNHENHQHGYGYEYKGIHEEGHKWNGPLHYPKIYKGVPVEPVEVQQARAAHLKAFSGIKHYGGDYGYSNENRVHHHETHNVHETPKIGHDGQPMDTYEVESAKSKHFAAVKEAIARNSHGISHHYRKRRGAESYVHFTSVVQHEVPVNHHQHDDYHYENDDDDSQYHEHDNSEYSYQPMEVSEYDDNHHDTEAHGFSYQQNHAPVYGQHHDNEHKSNGFQYSYEQIHVPVYSHQDGHKYREVAVIGQDGMPVDTIEVQKAKAAHLAAYATAKSKHY